MSSGSRCALAVREMGGDAETGGELIKSGEGDG